MSAVLPSALIPFLCLWSLCWLRKRYLQHDMFALILQIAVNKQSITYVASIKFYCFQDVNFGTVLFYWICAQMQSIMVKKKNNKKQTEVGRRKLKWVKTTLTEQYWWRYLHIQHSSIFSLTTSFTGSNWSRLGAQALSRHNSMLFYSYYARMQKMKWYSIWLQKCIF